MFSIHCRAQQKDIESSMRVFVMSKTLSSDRIVPETSNDNSETSTNVQNEPVSAIVEPGKCGGSYDIIKQSDCDKQRQAACSATLADAQSIRQGSLSRASSLQDVSRSLMDSISAASGRQNWNGKDMVEDDPSISSLKGDSISATIADYQRKHRAQTSDSQSRTSNRLPIGGESSPKTDDLSSNINFYAASGSNSCAGPHQGPATGGSQRPGDFASVSSNNANVDAFDIIEESSAVSLCDDLGPLTSNNQQNKHHNVKKHRSRHLLEQAFEIDDLPQDASVYQIEPIILRGNGNLTLFGLSNSFSNEFPSALIGRVSKEEFNRTMRRVNSLLRDQQSLSARLLLFGSLCCCCSLGFSVVWPSIALKRRSKTSLEKFLTSENNRLYAKLGLNWKLAEQRCYSNQAFVEYVLKIEFLPKINLYLPD